MLLFFITTFTFLLTTTADSTDNTTRTTITVVENNRIREKRMIGGHPTTIESHPWHVAIELDGDYYCSGTIISYHFILTAAHCVNFDLKSIKIHSGTSLKLKNSTVHRPIEKILHPQYEINEYLNSINDIALIRVNETFLIDSTRKSADLNSHVQSENFGAKWTEFTSWSSDTDQLQVLLMPMISRKLCNSIYKKFGGIKEGQICAGYIGIRNKDSCTADSGAALIYGSKVIGVLAYSEGECGTLDYPTVFMEVAYYYDWILGYIKSDSEK